MFIPWEIITSGNNEELLLVMVRESYREGGGGYRINIRTVRILEQFLKQ